MAIELKCFKCNESLSFTSTISRHDECPKCRSDVRCCKNCEFYDAKVYNECKEPQAERVLEKERANHCDFFRPRTGGVSYANEQEKHLSAAEALFKGLK